MIYVSNNDIIVMFDNLCYHVSLSVLISTHVPAIFYITEWMSRGTLKQRHHILGDRVRDLVGTSRLEFFRLGFTPTVFLH